MKKVIVVVVFFWYINQLIKVNWADQARPTNLDLHEYVHRRNQYPRTMVKLGYYLERYVESVEFLRIRQKMFEIADLPGFFK